MRVSLQIDGDASGAQKAAQDASAAIVDLGKNAEGAAGSVSHLANASTSGGAANDNQAASAGALAQKVADLANKALGANSAFSKAAEGAAGLADKVGAAVRAAGPLGLLTGGLGLAITAASTFHEIINRGSKDAATQLTEQARLVGVVRDAYKTAGKSAGEFYEQSAALTRLQTLQNIDDLSKTLHSQVGQFISGATTFGNIGDILTQTKQVKAELLPFEDAIFKLSDGFKNGTPDVKAFVDEVARLALIDPTLQKTAFGVTEAIKEASKTALGITRDRAVLDRLDGKPTKGGDGLLGLSKPDDGAGSFERLAKAIDRQSAAQAAEAQTAGLAAGASAKLRTEFVLTEAVLQTGAKDASEYADQIQKIATRAGEAAQKVAQARLASDTAFNRDQLGRTTLDASVADQLRGSFGNNADLNGYEAGLIRVNEQMKELKGTTQEFASGAFREFRTEIQNGTNVWEAFGKAGVNALGRITDKLADKAFDKLITGAIGSFLGIGGTGTVGNGGIVLGGPAGPGVFAAAGGGDFGPGWGVVGEEGAEIIKVHAGGVTVYPHHVSKPYLPGFADGGSLSPWGNVARLPRGGQDNSQGGPQALAVSIGVTVDDDGKLKAYVKNVSAQTTSDGITGYASSPAFIAHVADASNAAKTRGFM